MLYKFNLLFVKNIKSLAKSLTGTTEPEEFVPTYNKIVDDALKQYFSADEFDTIVNKFRRSPWNEDAFKKDLERLDSPEHIVPKDEHYYHAINYIRDKYFTPDNLLLPVHFTDLRKYPWELSTSVGAPYATSKSWNQYVEQKFDMLQGNPGQKQFSFPEYRDLFAEAHSGQSLEPTMVDARMSKRNLYNESFFIDRKHIHLIKDGKTRNKAGHDLRYWNVAFARQHLVAEDEPDKVRLVFGAPWLFLKAEMMFVWPIQAWLLRQGKKSPMLWGFETLTGGWYRLRAYFSQLVSKLFLCFTLDWSGFDRYARHTVLDDIHSLILRPMFTFHHGYHPTVKYEKTTTDPQRLENLWNWMTDAVKSTPLLLPNGDLIRFQHSGIFSGYLQTQLLDSIYNLVMIYTILFRLGFKEEHIFLKVQGDDSIILLICCFALVYFWFIDMFSHYAKIYFGAVVSEKKSAVSDTLEDAEVLKYKNRNGIPYRDSIVLAAQLRHPERSHALGVLKARSIGIAHANCGSDPRLYKACESIFQRLDALGVKSSAKGLPDQILFMTKFLRLKSPVNLEKFPSYYETVCNLVNDRQPMPTKGYWNTDHFLGYPGEVTH